MRAWGVLFCAGFVGCAGGGAEGSKPVEAGTLIDIHVTVPTSHSPSSATNATLAAVENGDGTWAVLTPSEVGHYGFRTLADRWTVVFVCADDRTSLVAVYERLSKTASLDVVLEEQCGPASVDSFLLDGTLRHAPASSAWLDFGYGLESRGAVVVASGDSVPYEIVNVVPGTWDFAFGLRDESAQPFSRMALVRDVEVGGDSVVDVDLAGNGLVPGSSKLGITGAGADALVVAPIRYATKNALSGIDVGPQDLDRGKVDDLAYSTIPVSAQLPEDRYRAEIRVNEGKDNITVRGFDATFHSAFDLGIDLLAPMAAPESAVAATDPILRLTTKVGARPEANEYEILCAVQLTDDTRRAWSYSTEAALVQGTLEWTMPDLTALAGWSEQWNLPPNRERKTTAKVIEAPAPFGDGTRQRFAAQTISFDPRL